MSPVVITLVSDGSRCLLARQPSFPQGMYTALSGFCDMGKAVSDPAAVASDTQGLGAERWDIKQTNARSQRRMET